MEKFLFFKDLNITFKPHPITGDLTVTKDEAAIKQSIINLLLTLKGERPFNSEIGSSISALLFEPLDYGTAGLIRAEVLNVLNAYEPRIDLQDVECFPDYDSNSFEVNVIFAILGRDDLPVTINFFLERTR